jgi:hypothetical protein
MILTAPARPGAQTGAAPKLNPAFEALVDRYVAERRGRNDGSEAFFLRQVENARSLLAELRAIDRSTLSFDQDIDYRYLEGLLQTRILDGEKVRRWEKDPTLYVGVEPIISPNGGLLNQETRPLAERAAAVLEVMRNVPARLDNAKKNLQFFIPLWLEPAKAYLDGVREVFEKDIPRWADRVPASRDALLAENQKVLAALDSYGKFLEGDLPRRPVGDWRVGKEVFDHRLRQEHQIDMDAEAFYAWGRAEYQEQLDVLARAASRVDRSKSWQEIERKLMEDYPSAESMVYEFHKAVRRTRPWLLEQDLASIPWDKENAASAIATPAYYGKQTFTGFGGAPSGIGSTLPGAVMLAPLDPAWSPERQREFLRAHHLAFIWTLMPHEVYPGHALVQLYLNHNPRKLRAVASAYTNQSWCYYVEWVLTPEHGFYPQDKQALYTVEMERLKLWRYARVIYDAGMHLGKVSFEEAVDLMTSGVLFPERFAALQVMSATHGYGNAGIATLGYHQVVALRDEYFAAMLARGRAGTLKDFHDRFLRTGMLPMKLQREALLHDIDREGPAAATSN